MTEEAEEYNFEIHQQTILGDFMQWMVMQFRDLPKPWDAMSEREQENWLDRCEAQASEVIRQVITIVANRGFDNAGALVESVTFKDGVKAVLKLHSKTEGAHALADREGGYCVLVMADPEEFFNSEGVPKPEPDQRGLDMSDEAD